MKRKIVWVLALCLALLTLAGCNSSDYKKAAELYEAGDYQAAAEMFDALGEYEDSAAMAQKSWYGAAKALYDGGDFAGAEAVFTQLGGYEDSADMITACRYGQAGALAEARDFDGALALYEELGEYEDAADKLQEMKNEIMLRDYGDVLEALDGGVWYFNGGADNIIDRITFSGTEAEIAQMYVDGNRGHDNGSNTCTCVVDGENITVTSPEGGEMVIPYRLEGEKLVLDSGYRTAEQIDADIQGFWRLHRSENLLGRYSESEYNIQFDHGTVRSERAVLAWGYTNGEYYYYGPYQGSYTVGFGTFETEMDHGEDWFFNIIDGKAVILYFDGICQPADGLPGENGYSF